MTKIIGLGLEKYPDYLTGLGLTLWYIGFGLEKYSDYLTGPGLISWYIGLGKNTRATFILTYKNKIWA